MNWRGTEPALLTALFDERDAAVADAERGRVVCAALIRACRGLIGRVEILATSPNRRHAIEAGLRAIDTAETWLEVGAAIAAVRGSK